MTASPRILVVCTGNRCRSQMAQGWLSHYLPEALVRSAGTEPKGVHPRSILAMAEVGIDISEHTSDHISQYLEEDWDLVVTVCDSAKETCPVVPGARIVAHKSFTDPDDETLSDDDQWELFQRVRDEIGAWAADLAGAFRGEPA